MLGDKELVISTHYICFHGEIKENINAFWLKTAAYFKLNFFIWKTLHNISFRLSSSVFWAKNIIFYIFLLVNVLYLVMIFNSWDVG